MNRSQLTLLKFNSRLCIAFILSFAVMFFQADTCLAEKASLETISVVHDPLSVQFYLSRKVPVKVVKVEKNELLIALKDVERAKNFEIRGREKSAIKSIGMETLQGGVVAVVLTGHKAYNYLTYSFNNAGSVFTVDLEKRLDKPKPELRSESQPSPEKKPEPDKKTEMEPTVQPPAENIQEPPEKTVKVSENPAAEKLEQKEPEPEVQPVKKEEMQASPEEAGPAEIKTTIPTQKESKIPTPAEYTPPERQRGKFHGDIGDLVTQVDEKSCSSQEINDAGMLIDKKKYGEAFDILDQYAAGGDISCLEEAVFLRAYAFHRFTDTEESPDFLRAGQMYQEALVSYPGSSYTPYAYAGLGIIQKKMKNPAAALGYFNIVQNGYMDYTGMPEILFHSADIYFEQGYLDKASKYYRQVFEDPLENSYIAEAGIGYGKSLFQQRRYLEALMILNYVVSSTPRKIYDSYELLKHIGDANFEVGQSRLARENLTRTLNLFPDIQDPDIVLSRIGDTYGMENNSEKAVKIYTLVREKYPDSQGYVASSIGIARYLKDEKEKIEIYEMIKNRFPENSFARIAMMRLAEIYQSQGEYNKCIKEIEDLLSTHPRGLRYEAVKLMQKAYEALFKEQLKTDEFTKILNRYELEHERIDRMGSRDIEMSVGLAYLEAKLYEESFNHLLISYKQYKRALRPKELLFGLGAAMDESGRDEDALKLFNSFSKRFPKDRMQVQVLTRTGNIYLEKNRYKLADSKFKQAYQAAGTHLEKGDVLLLHSNVSEKKKDMETAAGLREKAVTEISLAAGENYGVLARAHKQLGKAYMDLRKYVKAADSFSKALKLSKDEDQRANLGFLVGDSYQKGNILAEAKKAFEQVTQSSDSIWARMAQQRLNILELSADVQNS